VAVEMAVILQLLERQILVGAEEVEEKLRRGEIQEHQVVLVSSSSLFLQYKAK
jgi:hypothetical protein